MSFTLSRVVALGLLAGLGGLGLTTGCAEEQPQRLTIIKPPPPTAPMGGISPDEMVQIQVVFQQRDSSARKCYQDVMDEKHSRSFQGAIGVVVALNTTGQATDVRVTKNTLNDQSVQDCLVDEIKQWEFPALKYPGEVPQEWTFRPQY